MKKLPVALLLLAALPAGATPITYSVNQIGPTASAVGTITTDGTLGTLTGNNILDYTFTVSVAAFSHSVGKGIVVSAPAQSDTFSLGGAFLLNAPLTATATGLFYDFTNPAGGYADFSDSTNENTGYNAFVVSRGNGSGGDPGFIGASVYVNDEYSEVLPLSGNDEFASVSSTTAAVTPEPSSLILLGTGAVGLLSVLRRRSAI